MAKDHSHVHTTTLRLLLLRLMGLYENKNLKKKQLQPSTFVYILACAYIIAYYIYTEKKNNSYPFLDFFFSVSWIYKNFGAKETPFFCCITINHRGNRVIELFYSLFVKLLRASLPFLPFFFFSRHCNL